MSSQPPATGYPVTAAPAQYQGMSYTATPPAYVSVAPPSQPQATDLFNKAGKQLGKALDGLAKKAGNLATHVSAAGGLEKGFEAIGGKMSYVTNMVASGGTSLYWKKMFDQIQPNEKLVDTFACYMFGQNGKVPGVLFIGSLSIAFCSDNSLMTPQGNAYIKAYLPYSNIASYQPSAKGTDRYVGAIMLDGYQFWFSGFSEYDTAFKTLSDCAAAFRSR